MSIISSFRKHLNYLTIFNSLMNELEKLSRHKQYFWWHAGAFASILKLQQLNLGLQRVLNLCFTDTAKASWGN